MVYSVMGDVLVAQEGREKESISMFQNACEFFTDDNSWMFVKLGQTCRSIGASDVAIAYLDKSISIVDPIEDERLFQVKVAAKKSLGNTHLKKFYAYESTAGIPERNDELIRKALFWSEAAFECQGGVNLACSIDLAQEHYFLGDSEKAHNMLKEYLDAIVKLGPSHCQTCHQTCANHAIMEKSNALILLLSVRTFPVPV